MFVHLYIPSRADLLGCTCWSKRTVCSPRALLSVICTSPSNFYCRCYSPRWILTHSPQDISPKKRLLKLVELFSVHIWPKQKATAAQNVVYKSRKTLSSLPDAFNLQLQKFGHAQKATPPPPPWACRRYKSKTITGNLCVFLQSIWLNSKGAHSGMVRQFKKMMMSRVVGITRIRMGGFRRFKR